MGMYKPALCSPTLWRSAGPLACLDVVQCNIMYLCSHDNVRGRPWCSQLRHLPDAEVARGGACFRKQLVNAGHPSAIAKCSTGRPEMRI